MKKIIKVGIVFMLLALSLCACTRREVHTIEANQTAFLIPLKGDTGSQASFESEELLNEAKVAAKQVYITETREKMGFLNHRWVADNMLIIVDRTPVTREWSSTADVGTSNADQAIYAESKESIGFSVGMNCSAQIYTEDDAVKFLYSYNNQSLSDIMDKEIRARVESDFVEMCAKYTMQGILEEKQAIMNAVRDDVTSYFAERGITITVLGMKDGIKYDDPTVQAAINAEFVADRNAKAQAIENQTRIEKAKSDADAKLKAAQVEAEAKLVAAQAEADAISIAANAQAEANAKIAESLTPDLLEQEKNRAMYEAWAAGGAQVPQIIMGNENGTVPFIDINKLIE